MSGDTAAAAHTVGGHHQRKIGDEKGQEDVDSEEECDGE